MSTDRIHRRRQSQYFSIPLQGIQNTLIKCYRQSIDNNKINGIRPISPIYILCSICFLQFIEGLMSTTLRSFFLLIFLLVLAQAHPHNTPSCPVGSQYLTLHHGHLTISVGGSVSLTPGIDSLCYNYPLPSPFQQKPGVALAISHFEANPSQQLFFAIQTSKTDSVSALSFMIRTQWKYTQWSMFKLTFFAEDHHNYEASSFMIDTTALAGCSSNKEVNVMLPFKNSQFVANKAVAFLNGFQISTASGQSGPAPFEVQIMNISPAAGGVSIRITATTGTKVYMVVVSYIAWSAQAQEAVGSTYEYNSFAPLSELSTTIFTPASTNTHDVYGFSGFIIGSGRFLLSATLSNNAFSFTTATTFTYLSFGYFFINIPPCSQCQGYPIPYNGQCIAQCPPGTVMQNGQCVPSTPQCPPGTYWNGTACVSQIPQCPSGQYWNGTACCSNGPQCPAGTYWNGVSCVSQTPQCPPGTYWNGTACVSQTPQCPSGQYWNGSACVNNCNSCTNCPPGTSWNGSACVSNTPNCPPGTYWNGSTCCPSTPSCPSGQQWNGSACVTICTGGRFWNGSVCVCPNGQYWSGSSCLSCQYGQIWCTTTLKCICPPGQFWNNYQCITCPSGQFWNQQTLTCSCPLGQFYNGSACVFCDGGRQWNEQSKTCLCPNGLNWNGSQCVSCPHGQNWNGFVCIACQSGQVWNNVFLMCECPSGQQWDGYKCLTPCPPGQISVNGICQCPANTYLVNGQCRPTPQCPHNQQWNGHACIPISCPVGYFWNGNKCSIDAQNCPAGTYYDGFSCVAITNNCPPGTRWNGQICVTNSTQCPAGTYWTGSTCAPISSQCPPTMHWVNGQCIPIGNQCPPGTNFNGQSCIPNSPCTDGRVWNQALSQCICPSDSFWNGNKCIKCGGGQIYESAGCFCPVGLFWNGNKCELVNSTSCSFENSHWVGGQCQCRTGFMKEGKKCMCKGLISGGACDPCYMKPFSEWRFGQCQCISGFYQQAGKCIKYSNPPSPTPPIPPTTQCNVATFWDSQERQCLPCSDGCLSCLTCYECLQCRPGYTFNPVSKRCVENCGDGLRFTLACDDGNNFNGDGCSADCKIESGYHCVGGSPASKDTCSKYLPSKLVITQSGQSHLMNKIVLNVRVNYLPPQLLETCVEGKNRNINCESILDVDIIKGDKAVVGITAKYIPTTSYSFSVEINFGREPIGLFTARIGIAQSLAQQYFAGMDTSQRLEVDVNPAFLSVYTGGASSKSSNLEDTLL